MMERTVCKRGRILSRAVLALFLGILAVSAIAFGAGSESALAAQGSASQLVVAQADDLEAGSSEEAGDAEVSQFAVSDATVKARAYVQDSGWTSWVAAGKRAGTTGVKGLRAIKLSLDGIDGLPGGLDGHIYYMTYDKGKGWGSIAADGASSKRTSIPVQAVKVWLSGSVSQHYDVLYRVRIAGKGWQPWVKNKAKSGTTKSGLYATAIQVKLSPKTEEAAGKSASTVGVRYQARMKATGWQAWTGDGKKAGKKSKKAVVDGFALRVDSGDLQGAVQYRAYIQGKGWGQGWKSNGKTAGVSGKRIEALQLQLSGTICSSYNLYYRTYVYGYGWLDWARAGETSGSTGLDLPIAAVKVRLVKKTVDASALLSTDFDGERATTVNQLMDSLNGIDISSWQAGIDISNVDADFVIVKATGGTGYTNPYFKSMANATIKSGKLLGLYHFAREATSPGTAVAEADHFVNAAKSYVGRAVLVLDWERDYSLGPTWVKKFCNRVYKKTGVRPLVYMSKSYTRSYDWTSVAKNYQLWVAQYSLEYLQGTGYVSQPWTDGFGYGAWDGPIMYQYTSAGRISGYSGDLDLDIFYGSKADWEALAAVS